MLHDGRSGKKKVAIQSAQSIGWATSDDRCVKAGVYEVVRSCESQRRAGSRLSLFETILQETEKGNTFYFNVFGAQIFWRVPVGSKFGFG